MPTPVYSRLLYEGVVSSTSVFTELWTVPSGRVWIMRDIDGQNRFAGAQTVYFNTDSVPLWALAFTAAGQVIEWRGRQVFPAGHQLFCEVAHADVVLRISGYDLAA